MSGIAQVWLTEDELDTMLSALLRMDDEYSGRGRPEIRTLIDKLTPISRGLSCEVSSEGGATCTVEYPESADTGLISTERRLLYGPLGACEGDLLTELK